MGVLASPSGSGFTPSTSASSGGGGTWSSGTKILPPAYFPIKEASPQALDKAAGEQRRYESINATNQPVPIVYGRAMVAGLLFTRPVVYNGYLTLAVAWCLGPADAIETILVDDQAMPSGVLRQDYLGSANTLDSTLAAAFAWLGRSYTDVNAGLCYSVLRFPQGSSSGFPRLTAIVRGMKVYDPRSDTTAWSDNPALCLRDFLTSEDYGCGWTVNEASVETVADWNDTDLNPAAAIEKHRTINLAITQQADVDTHIEALRTYAGCFVVRHGNVVHLIPNRDDAVAHAFTEANIVEGTFAGTKRGVRDVPTEVVVYYTDTTVKPYREIPAGGALATDVTLGLVPRRTSEVRLPGITRYSQAKREEVERLNSLMLQDLSISFATFDESIALREADIITVTHSYYGWSAKKFRVTSIYPAGPGRYQITAQEHNASVYSTSVVSNPEEADSENESPLYPPTPTGLSMTEELFQTQGVGLYSSRMRATWDALTYTYFGGYLVTLSVNGVKVDQRTVYDAAYASPPVQEGVTYLIDVKVISTVGVLSSAAQDTETAQGKQLKPGAPSSLSGFAINNEVFLRWGLGVDLDLTAYELRYGAVGGSWSTATVIDRIPHPQQAYRTKEVPPGTWVFYVKSLDSVRSATYPYGQESDDARSVTFTVYTSGSSASLPTHEFSSPTLTAMTAYTIDGETYWVTDFGDGVGYGADNTDNAVGTFGDSLATVPLASPHSNGSSSGVSKWVSETWDMGTTYAATLLATWDVTDLVGTSTKYIETSPDGSTWTPYAGTTLQISTRYVRMRVETSGAMVVNGAQTVRLYGEARTEHFSGTTDANGKALITLSSAFMSCQSITVTSNSVTAGYFTADQTSMILSAGRGIANGKGLNFDGSDDWVSAPTIAATELSTNLTLECWFYVNPVTSTWTSGRRMMICKTKQTATRYRFYLAGTYSGGSILPVFGVYTTSGHEAVTGSVNVRDGLLHHLAGVKSGSTLYLYLDGALIGSTTIAGTFGAPTSTLGIGAWPTDPDTGGANPQEFWNGFLDDVRIWNTARSQSDIQSNMSAEVSGAASGLVAYYKLNETGLGTTSVADATSNANTGTANSFASTSYVWRPTNGFVVFGFNSAGAALASAPFSGSFTGF